ncbi:MAG TPA: ABC transporter permease subunit [Phycisphaerales bacterium]|nr:ABC transporter permease subunit [Phycisphaerales bacterium]
MPILLRWFLRLGPTNPIAVRLVQNGSRRSRHHYIRIAYLGSLILVLLWALFIKASGGGEQSYQKLAAAGSSSFEAIAFLQIGLICILAPVFMAGAIAQEADPRTWDILLTTPLKASEIVLGNLLGRLFFILALLFSSLPLFAITQYFGGVSPDRIFGSYAISAGAALFVGSTAIFLSVSRLVGKRAVFAFYVTIVSYLAVTYAIDTVAGSGGVTYMTAVNPFLALKSLLNSAGYPTAPEGTQVGLARYFLETPVRTFCFISIGVSVALIILSAITVRLGGIAGAGGLFGRDGSRRSRKSLVDPHSMRDDEHISHRPPKSVWHNPIAWREAAGRTTGFSQTALRWLFIVAGVLWGVFIIYMYHTGRWNATLFRQVLLATAIGEMVVITLVTINLSATSVSKEREDGTLDLLLTTPITPSQYLSGKLKGLVTHLLPLILVPVVTVALAGLYVLTGGLGKPNLTTVAVAKTQSLGTAGGTISVPVVLPEAGLIMAACAIPFFAFCVIVGMQWSLKSRGTLGSVTIAVAIIGAIAGTAGLCAWNAASDVPAIGPVLGALSPISAAYSSIVPETGMEETMMKTGEGAARTGLFIGALIAVVLYGLVVYAVHGAMTRSFDFTVRRLAGMK